jgi:perosamine synthetase
VVQLAETFSSAQRDAIVRQLAERGIGCGRYFAPIHMQPAYQQEKHRSMDLPVTESIGPRTLALPFFNKITEAEIEEVCRTVQELISKF